MSKVSITSDVHLSSFELRDIKKILISFLACACATVIYMKMHANIAKGMQL